MDIGTQRKDCDALASLFQHIVTDLRSSTPIWEDFLSKSLKLQSVLRSTAMAIGIFLDAFQKVADLASNSHGATRDLGSALTRLCLRHRSVENQLRAFASCIGDKLHDPLQSKLDEWKRVATQMEKDHHRDYKRTQQEIKKSSADLPRLQKRAGKGRVDARQKLDQVVLSVSSKYRLLETTEMSAVRAAMIEERSRFCFFVDCFQPLLDSEHMIQHELSRLQEVVDVIAEQTKDPAHLPPSGEQVLSDLKSSNTDWTYQTPPGSPVLSSMSRKSSMCSMDSSSSGSTQYSSVQSPNHRIAHLQLAASSASELQELSCVHPLSSVSSQDSGYVSHDVITSHYDQIPANCAVGHRESLKDLQLGQTADDVNYAAVLTQQLSSTLIHSSSGPTLCSHVALSGDRSHTISSPYARPMSRASLTPQTFEPPSIIKFQTGSSIYATPSTVAQRTADIYARPNLSGRRGTVPVIQPVAPPVVPSEYAASSGSVTSARLHRCSSLPSSEAGDGVGGGSRLTDDSDVSSLLRHRQLVVKDDNYISHNHAALQDSNKLPMSHDYESLLGVVGSKTAMDDSSLKSRTLPRCQQFKIPHGRPQRPPSAGDLTMRRMSQSVCRSRPPPPPVRRNSTITTLANCSCDLSTSSIEQNTTEIEVHGTTGVSQRQQAPPTDDDDDMVVFPSPPSELSCASTVIHWPTDERLCAASTSSKFTMPVDCPRSDVQTSEVCGMVETGQDGDDDSVDSTLVQIRRGVKLRRTISNDRDVSVCNTSAEVCTEVFVSYCNNVRSNLYVVSVLFSFVL